MALALALDVAKVLLLFVFALVLTAVTASCICCCRCSSSCCGCCCVFCSMLASSLLRLPSMFLLLFLFLSYIASPRGWRCCGAAGDTATMLKLLPFCFELLLLLLQQLQHWPQPNCRESRAKHSQAALENYNNKKCCLFLCGSEFSRRILFCCSAKNRTKRY